jgi:hypothetical protein
MEDIRFRAYYRRVWDHCQRNTEFMRIISDRGPLVFAEAIEIMAMFTMDAYEVGLTADMAAEAITSLAIGARAEAIREQAALNLINDSILLGLPIKGRPH